MAWVGNAAGRRRARGCAGPGAGSGAPDEQHDEAGHGDGPILQQQPPAELGLQRLVGDARGDVEKTKSRTSPPETPPKARI